VIKTISLDEILGLEDLIKKEYLIKTISKDDPREIELRYRGENKEVIYIGRKQFNNYKETKEILMDDEGLPYFKIVLGPIEYNIYEKIFLGNTDFGSAMGGLNQKLLLNIFNRIKKENHQIDRKFRDYIYELIKKAPEIKEALNKKYYFENEEALKEFSNLDLEIFKYLTAKNFTFRSGAYNPDNYCIDDINLNDEQKIDCFNGESKEEAAFIVWYRNYMKSKNYQAKIENPWIRSSIALTEWINKIVKELESKSFKKVERLSL